jgi:hypothetical protein
MKKTLCFTKDYELEKAIQAFRDRYHLEPRADKLEHGILWVEPIPDAACIAGCEEIQVNLVELLDQNGDKMQLIMF